MIGLVVLSTVAVFTGSSLELQESTSPQSGLNLARLLKTECRVSNVVLDGEGNIFSVMVTDVGDVPRAVKLLADASALQMLAIQDQTLDSEIFASIARLPNLALLDLTGCQFQDKDLELLKAMPKLMELKLASTTVTDKTLEHVKTLPQLRRLQLYKTNVTGSGYKHLEKMPLQNLNLAGTKTTDKSLVALAAIRSLTLIDLHNTPVSDSGVMHLVGLYNLTKLSVNGTKVTTTGLERFRERFRANQAEAKSKGLLRNDQPDLQLISR